MSEGKQQKPSTIAMANMINREADRSVSEIQSKLR